VAPTGSRTSGSCTGRHLTSEASSSQPGFDERAVLSRTTLAAIAAAFLLIGVVTSAYGPLLGFLSHRFGVSLPVAGEVLSAHFAGGLVGVLGTMRGIQRFANRHVAVAALGSLGLGSALVVVAPTWPLLLAAFFVVGVGFGGLDIGLNQIVAHSAGAGRTSVINLLHGTFAIGAVLGPIVVALLGERRFTFLYVAIAVLAFGLIAQGIRIPGRLPVPSRTAAVGRPRGLVVVFVVAFALYVGTEIGVAGWSTSHLESVGLKATSAAAFTSGFWLAIGAGRLLVALLPSRVPEWSIITVASALGVVTLLAAISARLAPIAYVATGLVLAPIFPTGVVWLAKLLPGDARATAWLFPGAMLGGAFIPAGIGLAIARTGLGGAPVVLSSVALGTFFAFAIARLMSRRGFGQAGSSGIRQA
jgi:FHS family glucose/mannose:H+ symporter-like MFS transporter